MKSLNIMLVDNHAKFLTAARHFLEVQPQCAVSGQASSGREVLCQLTRTRPDLVLMDWDMPEMDGLEAMRRIKARCPAPAVIMLSLHDGPAYRAAAAAAGADGFVCKVEFCTQLLQLVRTLFGLATEPLKPHTCVLALPGSEGLSAGKFAE